MKNKVTKGVINSIMNNDVDNVGKFIKTQKKDKHHIIPFMDQYEDIYNKIKEDLMILSDLEEIILQNSAIYNMGEIKFSTVREYIYARTDFFRQDKTTKDIRVIVAKISDVTNNIDDLPKIYQEKRFIEVAKSKLIDTMFDELKNTISRYKEKYGN